MDGFGNVTRVTEPNPADGSPYVTQYLYDRIDHLTLVSMPRNGYTQTRSFVYDPVSFKLMNETHPETGMTKYEYHPGPHSELRLWIKTDAKNQQTKIEDGDYDVYGRPVRMKFLAPVAANAWAEDPCQQVTYTYDNYPATAGSNLSNGFGRVTTTLVGPGDATAACKVNAGPADGSRTNQNFLQAFGYTSAGQIALKRLQFSQIVTPASGMAPPATVTTWDTKYTYDDEGFQTSVTYPMGQTHLIGLDFLKRPYSLTYQKPGVSVPGPFIQSVGYNAADQMTEIIWGDNGAGVRDPDAYSYGVTYERRTYNQTNQLTRIYAFPANQAATVDLNYQYPAGQNNGQISSVTSGTDGNFNATYTYDSLKRLTALGGAKIQNYSYDGWGNLYSKTGDGSNFTVNIDSGTNWPYGGGICYDLNGNLLSTVSQCAPEYVYDMKNRLVKVAVSSNGMTDVSGHVDLSAELYFYTADNKRVTTVRPNGNLAQVFYVYGAKSEIAAICTTQIFGQAPVCDPREPRDLKFAGRLIRQNNVPVSVDRLGSVIANPAGGTGSTPPKYYLPFGEQYNSTQSPPSVPGNTNFATYFKDQSTGLDYADQRFYNSNNGFSRFMTADPYRDSAGVGNPGSWNRYLYVENDPVNHTDPRGLFTCDPDTGTSVTVCADADPVYVDQSQQSPGQQGSSPNPNATQTVGGLTFANLGSSGSREKQILALLDFIKGNIDSNCTKWLTGGAGFSQSYSGGLGQVIQALESGGQDASGNSVPTIGFATVTGQPGFVNNATEGSGVNALAIVVNVEGSVFSYNAPRSSGVNYNGQISGIVSGSQRAGVFVLLHELAHLLSAPGFRADNGNFQNGKLNNDDVYANCAKTVNAASNR